MTTTEVGAAYVTIIPSAKGFARSLQKSIAKEFGGAKLDKMIEQALAGHTVTLPVRPEIRPGDLPDELPVRRGREPKLPVRVDPLTKALQDDVRRQLAALSREVSAQIDVNADTDDLRTEISDAISAVERTLVADIPTEPGGRRDYERQLRAQVDDVSRRVRARIDADVDVDRSLRDGRVDAAGETVGRSLASSITSSVTSALGAVSGPVLFGGLVLAAVAVAPLIGASIAAGILGVLGGGVIAAGIMSLANNPTMQRAAGGLAGTIQSVLARAAEPLIGTEEQPGPLLYAIETLTDLVVELEPSIRQMFAAIGPYIPILAQGFAEFLREAMPGILAAVEAAGPFLESLAYNLGPLGQVVGDFLTAIAESGPAATMAMNVLLELVKMMITQAGTLIYVLSAAFGGIYDWFLKAAEWVQAAWDKITSIVDTDGATVKQKVEALVGATLRFLAGLWEKLTGGAKNALNSVTSQFSSLGGRIKNAVGNLGTLLLQAGRNVVQGLIDGIKSKFGALGTVASSLAGTIRNYLPFSPAKEGPLSGRGNPYYSGQSIVQLLASGVTSTLGTARAAADDLAGTFALGGSPVATAPTVGGYGLTAATTAPAPLTVEWVGGDGDPIVQALRDHVRIYYSGSAQAALGS